MHRILLAGLLGSWLAVSLSLAEDLDLSRFEKTTICGDLVQPLELDVAPDGKIFLIELGGTLKVIDPINGKQVVAGKLEVTTAQENGLIGMALDPHFADNGWIYLQYSPPEFSGQHVSRFNFRDGALDLGSEKVLFKYEEQRRECCHHAGSLEFGPDGNLYIGTGDNTNPFNDSQGYAPLDQRDDRQPWDAQRTSGNTRSYNGKVLRIHPEPDGTYSIPEGNLFPKNGSLGHPEIYVMGCRNPWRISIDQRTGFLYWGDVGPDAGGDNERGPRGYDEFNQARTAGNFGWPYFIGDNFAYPIIDFKTGEIQSAMDPAQPFNRSVNNTGNVELPPAQPALIYYPSDPSEKFPEIGRGGRTACTGPVYYYDRNSGWSNRFPAAYDQTLFAFEWSRNAIYAVHLDSDSQLKSIERFLPETPFIRPVDMVFDAGGSLLVIEYGETWGVNADARLVRVDYVRGNRKPQAVAKAEGTIGREPLQVKLSATDSKDKDRDPLQYQWTSFIASSAATAPRLLGTTAELEALFDQPGVYTVQLTVTDSQGSSDVTTLPVVVGNARPEVTFLTPQDGDFFSPGQPIRYQVVVRDKEDGTSDQAQAEQDDWELIDSTASSRVFTESIVIEAASPGAEVPPGLSLIRKSDCLNCHAPSRPLVGPSFLEIANKYRNQPHQVDQTVQRVIKGSTGVWGKVGMLPHGQHTEAEVRSMVEYVFSATANSANPSAPGFNNELIAQKTDGLIRLEANYTDAGRDDIPKLIGIGTVQLRNRHAQAESADEIKNCQVLGSGKAENKQFVGAINHNATLKFNHVRLDELKALKVKVASAGVGGRIEIHRATPEGDLLGQTSVEVNGNWEEFYEKTIDLTPTTGRDDVFVVFKNEEHEGGLMNIDSLTFE